MLASRLVNKFAPIAKLVAFGFIISERYNHICPTDNPNENIKQETKTSSRYTLFPLSCKIPETSINKDIKQKPQSINVLLPKIMRPKNPVLAANKLTYDKILVIMSSYSSESPINIK